MMRSTALTACVVCALASNSNAGDPRQMPERLSSSAPQPSLAPVQPQQNLRGCSTDVLEFSLQAGSECVQPGETVTVILSQSELQQLVRGFQAFAEFDDTRLTHTANTFLTCPGTCPPDLRTPYGTIILNTVTGSDIDLAAGIDDSEGQSATLDDAPLVQIEFIALPVEGGTTIEFRVTDPPTRFSDFTGQNVTPCLIASPSIVIDGTPPVITCPDDAIVECDESTDPSNTGEATATDNLDGSPLVEYSDVEDLNGCNGTGTITRTWTATDCAGNSTSCEQIITVQDTTPPVFEFVPPDVTIECSDSLVPSGLYGVATGGVAVYYNDNGGGENPLNQAFLKAQIDGTNDPSGGVSGAPFVFSNAPLVGGNPFSWQALYSGLIWPESQFGLDFVLEAPTNDGSVLTPALNAYDNTNNTVAGRALVGSVVWAINNYQPHSPDISTGDVINSIVRSQFPAIPAADVEITQLDLSVAGPIYTIDIAGKLASTGIHHWYNPATMHSPMAIFGLNGDFYFFGTLTYDSTGDPGTDLIDFYSGTIELYANSPTTQLEFARATDNCGAPPFPLVTYSDDLSGLNGCSGSGTILRTWTATDACGNSTDVVQTITVEDTTPPTGTAGTIDSCYASAALAEAAAIAATTDLADNCTSNGDLVVTAATVGDCSATVTVTVADECGNSTDFEYFTRIDDEAPVLSCPPNPLGGLIISEIMDGTWPSGLPKFVELANCSSDPVDLSDFSLGNVNNGDATMGFDALVLSGILPPGEAYVVSYEDGDSPNNGIFYDVFGFNPDNLTQGAFINGNDVLVLFAGPALMGDPADGSGNPVIDVYGVVGVDGIGQIWEYTDGYSYRLPFVSAGNTGTFIPTEWFFGGADSLETGDDVTELALMLANTTPGTHECGGGTLVVSTDPGQCSAEVLLPETATDNCDGPVPVTYEADFGSGFEPITNPYTFPVGTWPVIGTAVDSCGLVGTCEFSVSVVDDEPPTGTQGTIDDCYPDNASAEAAAIAATTDLADNCTSNGDLLVTASTDGDCNAVVTVTVTDGAGNSTFFDYLTTVDGTPPDLACPGFPGDGGLIISELMDGTLPNGEPKFVEITNCTDNAIDLTNYRVALFANGSVVENFVSMDYGDMTTVLAAGESFIIANSNSGPGDSFLAVYGFEADLYHSVPNGNGNDVYQLMQDDGFGGDIVVDAYGVVGVNGTGEPWDYLDSYAYSLPNRSANGGAFDPANWFIAGPDALDGVGESGIAAVTSPGTHICSNVLTVKADAGGCDAVVVYPAATATDNCDPAPIVECFPPSGSVFDEGATQVSCTATDECGNVASCGFEVVVESVNELAVTVELQPNIDTGVTPPDTLTRCITFELWDCPGATPAATVSAEIVFDVTNPGGIGDPNQAIGSAVIDVPCGNYVCITARDELHTLRRTDETFGISGTQYLADFTGDPSSGGDWLIGGNLNDDEYIDVLDFGVFSFQFGASLPNDTTCATPFPHSDISGDGDVDNLDFSFILNNFLEEHEANCCGAPLLLMADGSNTQSGPVTNISVRELRRMGLGHLSRGDLNRDGWLNLDDIAAFLEGVRPAPLSAETVLENAEANVSQLEP